MQLLMFKSKPPLIKSEIAILSLMSEQPNLLLKLNLINSSSEKQFIVSNSWIEQYSFNKIRDLINRTFSVCKTLSKIFLKLRFDLWFVWEQTI